MSPPGSPPPTRGKLIMACGTGKTFAALHIAEQIVPVPAARVLFLVPASPCSRRPCASGPPTPRYRCAASRSARTSRSRRNRPKTCPRTTCSTRPPPAPTNSAVHASPGHADGGLTVVFSTYQSIDVVAQPSRSGLPGFDLIICDEAHRTTGVTLADADESSFVRVHDNGFIAGRQAPLHDRHSPHLLPTTSKPKAGEAGAVCGVDGRRETCSGPSCHRLGFGEAVEKGLAHRLQGAGPGRRRERRRRRTFQRQLADENHELELDDAAKIIGCWNGLAKRRSCSWPTTAPLPAPATTPPPDAPGGGVRRAASRCSKRLADAVPGRRRATTSPTVDEPEPAAHARSDHVDGTFNALERNDAPRLARRQPTAGGHLPHPLQRPLPVRRRRRARPGRGAVPQPAQLRRRRRAVRRPGDAQGRRARSTATSSCRSASPRAWRPTRPWPTTSSTTSSGRSCRPCAPTTTASTRWSTRSSSTKNTDDKIDVIGVGRRRPTIEDGSSAKPPTTVQGSLPFPQLDEVARRDLRQDRREGRRPRATGRTGPTTSPRSPAVTSPASTRSSTTATTGVHGRLRRRSSTGLRGNLNDAHRPATTPSRCSPST